MTVADPSNSRVAARKVLLIGWDAADWGLIAPLLDAGRMPHLKSLVNRGVMGNLATLYPILSPMLWTSIATGKRAWKHGIHGFSEPEPRSGGMRPISSLSRRCKAVWNILNQNGYTCGMGQQDLGYKRMFAHPEMVADLLRGFVREPWVAEVEMHTLLERVSGTYVSDDLREREDGIIWRVRWRGGWLYVYLLLEFQATVDSFMAVRILVYLGLLYQDLIRDNNLTPDGRLPPVLPVVLYSGDDGWTAATEISELIESVPGGLERYRPQMRYLLVEERGYTESELAPMRNLVAALFRLENSLGPEDIIQVLETLIDWLQAPEQADLARALCCSNN